jgi:hypothetical protein
MSKCPRCGTPNQEDPRKNILKLVGSVATFYIFGFDIYVHGQGLGDLEQNDIGEAVKEGVPIAEMILEWLKDPVHLFAVAATLIIIFGYFRRNRRGP